ncbi:MAG: pilus assembly protein PilV [Pseudomonadota bacterium]
MVVSSSNNQKKTQLGIGMVEVLITLFVLSVGLLGVASMQFISSFNNKNALARTQAVFVTQQMAELLRASMTLSSVTDGYVVDNAYFDQDNYNFTNLSCNTGASKFDCYCKALPVSIPDCLTDECNTAEFATFDAYKMSCAAVASNPDAEIFVDCADNNVLDADACTAGSIHRIIVRWPETGWQGKDRIANAQCNSAGNSDYDCVALEILL